MESLNAVESIAAIWFIIVFGIALLAPLFSRRDD